MAKPTIVTRTSKGSPLSWAEGDANFTNLQNSTITVTDGTNSKALDLNSTLTFNAGPNMAISVNATTGATTFYTSATTNTGTVTSVGGTGTVNGLTLTGTVTTTGNLTLGGTLSLVSPPAIGSTTANTGRFTTITSTIATGTAPFTVASTTNVANLNASSLNGATFAAPGAIGSTTANTGAFTTLSASSTVSGTGFSTYLASPPAIGGTTAAAISATTLTFKDTREAVFGLGTTGGTIAPNCANGTVQSITLNAALTIDAFTTPIAGQSLTLIINGGTSYANITSTMKFAGGIKTLTATAGCIDILTVYYDGTNYYASLGKGFA